MTPDMNDQLMKLLLSLSGNEKYSGLLADALSNTAKDQIGKKKATPKKGKRAKYEGSGVKSYDRNKGKAVEPNNTAIVKRKTPEQGVRVTEKGIRKGVDPMKGTAPEDALARYLWREMPKEKGLGPARPPAPGPPGRKRVRNEAPNRTIVPPYDSKQKFLESGLMEGIQGVQGPELPSFLRRMLTTKNVAKGVGAIGVGAFLADELVNNGGDIMDAVTGRSQEQAVQDALRFEMEKRRQAAKAERLQAQMSLNTARLAQMEPHLYNEVLAGRRLPQGAVVIGGTPRTDLLNELALGMSQGDFQQTSAQDELASFIK